MIRVEDLIEAIAECQGERDPNANTCKKLAAYYTILDHIRQPDEPLASFDSAENHTILIKSGSEFSELVNGKPPDAVMPLIDELVQSVAAVVPALYNAFIQRLKEV